MRTPSHEEILPWKYSEPELGKKGAAEMNGIPPLGTVDDNKKNHKTKEELLHATKRKCCGALDQPGFKEEIALR